MEASRGIWKLLSASTERDCGSFSWRKLLEAFTSNNSSGSLPRTPMETTNKCFYFHGGESEKRSSVVDPARGMLG